MRCISCSKPVAGDGALCQPCAVTMVSENPLAFNAMPLAEPSPLQGIAALTSRLPPVCPSSRRGGIPSPFELERWPFGNAPPDADTASHVLEHACPSLALDPRKPPALDPSTCRMAGKAVNFVSRQGGDQADWEALCRAANLLVLSLPSKEASLAMGESAGTEAAGRIGKMTLDLYDRALSLARGKDLVARNRGVALALLGRHAEAEEALSEVFEEYLDDPSVQYSMAMALSAQGRTGEAATFIDNAIKLDNRRAEYWLLTGAVSLADGDRDGASEAYENAVALDDSLSGIKDWLEETEVPAGRRPASPLRSRADAEREAELEERAKDLAAKERELYERILLMTRETSQQRERDLQALRVERLDLEGGRKELDAERERLRREHSAKEAAIQSRLLEAAASEKEASRLRAELDAKEAEYRTEKENLESARKDAFKGNAELERKLRKLEAVEKEVEGRESALRQREEELAKSEKDLRIRSVDCARQESDLKTRASELQAAESKLAKIREDVEERLRSVVRERGELNALSESLEGKRRDLELKERILSTKRQAADMARIDSEARDADRYVEREVDALAIRKADERSETLLDENQRLQRALVERERQLREMNEKGKSEQARQVENLHAKVADLERRLRDGEGPPTPAIEGKERTKQEESLSKIKMLQSSQRHAEAVVSSDAHLKEFGTSLEALLLKASSQIEGGEEDKALSTLELALSSNPKNESALVLKGRCLFAMGNFEEALKLFDKVGEANPSSADAWFYKAETLNRMGRWGGAIQFYNQTLAVNEKHAGAWNGKGDILRMRGKHEEARACYDQAISSDERFFDAWMGKAASLAGLGRWGGALQAIDGALALRQSSPEALLEKGKIYIMQGEKDKGLAELDLAEKADPSSAKPNIEKARALRSLSRFEAAMAEANKAVEKGGQTAEILRERGFVLLEMGKGDKALEELNRARALDPKDKATFLAAVKAMTAAGKYDDALAMLDAELKDDEDALLLKSRASVLMDMGLYDDSVKTYGRALMLNEEDVDTWLGLGIVLREKGEMNRAIKTFDKVLELDGKSREGWLNKGITFQRLEKDKEALVCYDKALEVDPNFAEVRKWRDTLEKKVKRRSSK